MLYVTLEHWDLIGAHLPTVEASVRSAKVTIASRRPAGCAVEALQCNYRCYEVSCSQIMHFLRVFSA